MTELTDLSDTDASNTEVSGEGISGATFMTRTDNVFQAVLGLLSRFRNANVFQLRDNADNTKQMDFDLSGITTGNERTLTVQDRDGTIAIPERLGAPSNLGITATVAANALTIAIKGFDGNDPSAGNPVYIPFRSVTAGSGDVDVLVLTAATSVVVSSGSTLGATSAVASTLIVVGFNDGGTFRLGVINPASGIQIIDGIASSTAEGGAGAADSAGVFYTGTAVTSKAYTVLGFVTSTQATAGTWATAPSSVGVGTDAEVMAKNVTADLPVFVCRAFVRFNGTGTPAILSSGNVSSITDNGTGDYTVNFTTAMPDANYMVLITVVSTGSSTVFAATGNMTLAAGSVRFVVRNTSGTATDIDLINVAIYR